MCDFIDTLRAIKSNIDKGWCAPARSLRQLCCICWDNRGRQEGGFGLLLYMLCILVSQHQLISQCVHYRDTALLNAGWCQSCRQLPSSW
jgi:hypothetical protein